MYHTVKREKMLRTYPLLLTVSILIQSIFSFILSSQSSAQEWAFRKTQGTLRVVDLHSPGGSVASNCAEGLVNVDKDNRLVPCLAQDWRWVDDRTIDFKLREDVRFHNGEKFNAETVKLNWQEYKKMEIPRPARFLVPQNGTDCRIIDDYIIRFTFPEPDGLTFVKFRWFLQIAPAFFKENEFPEKNWGYFPLAGPWGTGPFRFVEGKFHFAKPSEYMVLKAFERYWDRGYPKVENVIFDNTLITNKPKAMHLCAEQEGDVDIVTHIRPLDTLKIAESHYAKVVKSKDATILGAVFNQRKKNSIWKDIRFRKAVNYAINRRELWEYAAHGNAYNLGGFIPTGTRGHRHALWVGGRF